MSGCLAPSLCAASLLLTLLSTEMFFFLSALGRDLSCYPSQSMSVNFPCAMRPHHKCISVGGGTCQHCQLRCSQQSAQLHSSPRRLAPRQVISLAESLLPAGEEKKTPPSYITAISQGRQAICLLRASFLFLDSLEEAVAI